MAKIDLRHYSYDGFWYTRRGEKYCGNPALKISIRHIHGKAHSLSEPIVQWYKLGDTLGGECIGILGPKSAKQYWKNNSAAIRRNLPKSRRETTPKWKPIPIVVASKER